MNSLPKYIEWIFKIFVSVSIFALFGLFIFLKNRIDNPIQISPAPTASEFPTPTSYQTPQPSSSASPTLSPTPTPTATPKPTLKPKTITYVPLGNSGSTQSTNWTDIPQASVYINLIQDYGAAAVYWDAILHVDNSNGTTYARLFDVTHGVGVEGSEINISNTSTPTDIESGSLKFWAGTNLYRVQIKSLNSSTAFFDFGKIKIIY